MRERRIRKNISPTDFKMNLRTVSQSQCSDLVKAIWTSDEISFRCLAVRRRTESIESVWIELNISSYVNDNMIYLMQEN